MTRRLKSSFPPENFGYMRCPSLSSISMNSTISKLTESNSDDTLNKFHISRSKTAYFQDSPEDDDEDDVAETVNQSRTLPSRRQSNLRGPSANSMKANHVHLDAFSTATCVTSCDDDIDYESIAEDYVSERRVAAPPSTPYTASRRRSSSHSTSKISKTRTQLKTNLQVMSCKDAQKYMAAFAKDSSLVEKHRNCNGFQVNCDLCRMSLYYCPYCRLQ